MTSDPYTYGVLTSKMWDYAALWLILLIAVVAGGYAALTMEHQGHVITGMNNHVVWGLPHVFAVSLILTASGALNGASLASVFGQQHFKPTARLSIALAMSLLIGGLLVLVLDLGRPDRLIVAMTTYNFRSIFAWNIFLYTGFVVLGIVYLWFMLDRRKHHLVKRIGVGTFAWRLILTTGTGSIFGFLVGRNALDTALIAPLFIALSLVMGTAALSLVLQCVARWQRVVLPPVLITSLGRLTFWFLLTLVYFSIVHHVTNLYVVEHHAAERHTLRGGLSPVFWVGHILIGVIIPAALLWLGRHTPSGARLAGASAAALLGGGALIYVVIIGSQSTPQRLFPDKTVVASRFGDAGFPAYQARVWEWGLGLGGVATALLVCLLVLRVLLLAPAAYRVSED